MSTKKKKKLFLFSHLEQIYLMKIETSESNESLWYSFLRVWQNRTSWNLETLKYSRTCILYHWCKATVHPITSCKMVIGKRSQKCVFGNFMCANVAFSSHDKQPSKRLFIITYLSAKKDPMICLRIIHPNHLLLILTTLRSIHPAPW